MEQKPEQFAFTYSAQQQEEIKRIRQKYLPAEEDKMTMLRKLDERATRPGTIVALIVGIIGTLVLGLGLCCTMVWTEYFVLGIVLGIIGLAGAASAFPIYQAITKKNQEKIAPQIMMLTKELMGEE